MSKYSFCAVVWKTGKRPAIRLRRFEARKLRGLTSGRNASFADILKPRKDGGWTMDYSRFDDVRCCLPNDSNERRPRYVK